MKPSERLKEIEYSTTNADFDMSDTDCAKKALEGDE